MSTFIRRRSSSARSIDSRISRASLGKFSPGRPAIRGFTNRLRLSKNRAYGAQHVDDPRLLGL